MAKDRIAFYFDENMPVELANQLKRLGIDTVTVKDLELLGDGDHQHLQLAKAQDRVLCTYDRDYIRMAKLGIEHRGIVFIPGRYRDIGDLLRLLIGLHTLRRPAEMYN